MSREKSLAAAAEIGRRVDGIVTNSAVGIVCSVQGNLQALGSGTLLALGDAYFVLSAGHVLREAKDRDATVGIGASNCPFVAATRPWILSGGVQDSDEHDIALYRLTSEEAGRLEGAQFVRIGDVNFDVDLSGSFFVISGFPSMWSQEPSSANVSMSSKLLVYGTTLYEKEAVAFENFDSERHFLLAAPREEMYDDAGDLKSFRTRFGHPADFPDGLRGISGCAVWRLGPTGVTPDKWGEPGLVGVENAIYNKRQAIRATRWNSVTTLLHAAFPDVRPVLQFYMDMHE
jgi:hypothetical protein